MREHMIFGEAYEIRELLAVLSELEARINDTRSRAAAAR